MQQSLDRHHKYIYWLCVLCVIVSYLSLHRGMRAEPGQLKLKVVKCAI